MEKSVSESRILLLVGAVQFVNVLDFMMVMPLGPDFSKDLGISASHLGLIGGSYTAAAAVAGILGATFLDRFDRRSALAVTLVGLVIGTAMGGFAWDLPSLLFARVLAGAFGGPATSLSLAIVADRVPPERRGQAVGKVMAAFALASVFGVPVGLELARIGGWRLPFFGVAGLGVVVGATSIFLMPPSRIHLASRGQQAPKTLRDILATPGAVLALSAVFATMISVFSVVPYVSAFVQQNLGYPRENMGLLYGIGGAATLVANRVVGTLVDRVGATRMSLVGTLLMAGALVGGFVLTPPVLPVMAFFILFMASSAFRGVALNTLTSKVPDPRERAQFMSTQSAVQHIASACGAFVGSSLLTEDTQGRLVGMPVLAGLAVGAGLTLPVLCWRIGIALERRKADVDTRAPAPSAVG